MIPMINIGEGSNNGTPRLEPEFVQLQVLNVLWLHFAINGVESAAF